MNEQEYIAECRRLFNTDRYGWSVWEQEAAQEAFCHGTDPAEVVGEMNYQHQVRRANRSA